MRVIDKTGRLKTNDGQFDIDNYLLKAPTGGNYRFQDGNLQFWNPDTVAFHTMYPSGTEPGVMTTWGAADTSATKGCGCIPSNLDGANIRFNNGNLQFYNPDTLLWHTFYPTGTEPGVVGTWGAGEA